VFNELRVHMPISGALRTPSHFELLSSKIIIHEDVVIQPDKSPLSCDIPASSLLRSVEDYIDQMFPNRQTCGGFLWIGRELS
jgi:hypothetical protein